MRSNRHLMLRGALLASTFALAAFATAAVAQTYDFRVLHRFAKPGDAVYLNSGVQFDGAGDLYGTAEMGGATNGGAIYKIANDGARTESVLYSFDPADAQGDSIQPTGVVVEPSTGDIYGTTRYGGDLTCCVGYSSIGVGQIYKLAPDGTYTMLLAFNKDRDGVFPGPVIRDPQGNLYGMLQAGAGDNIYPTLFKYAADGTFTLLHVFRGYGFYRESPLIRDRAGNFYGPIYSPDGINCGSIYKLSRDGTYTTLHSFTGGADECYPGDLSGDQAGNLYGTAGGQNTVVFKLAADGTFTTLHTFTRGVGPFGHWTISPVLPVAGNLYGTADYLRFSDNRRYDTLYEITPDGTYTRLFDFGANQSPIGFLGLTLQHGSLYGTATSTNRFDEVYSFGAAPQ